MENFKRQLNNTFINKLNSSEWWIKLVEIVNNDKNYNIQIRNNYLNVYYKMNSLFKIDFIKDDILITTHYKFIPVVKEQPKGKEYINLVDSDGKLDLLNNIEQDCFKNDLISNLKRIEKQIDMFFGNEKYYQSKLIKKNTNIILDAEIQSNFGRIDLIALINNEIVAIELKRLFDNRLHDEIKMNKQLNDYAQFMITNKNSIKQAYKNTIDSKIALKLIDSTSKLYNVEWDNITVSEKPILAIVADVSCRKQDVINLYKKTFFERFKNNTYAVYMFGDDADITSFSHNSKKFI
ncbi:MAG: hypothetical protein WC149_09225 [Arcobacteraceae bacterium]|jgi:Holliday junction resolvase-like predicted endonuclease